MHSFLSSGSGRVLSLLVVTAALELGWVAPAHGEGGDRASAEALFRAGRQAMDQGDYKQACARFAESNRLDPALGTVFNLGACNEKLGHMAEAWQYFREVAERAPAGDDRATIARGRADALEASLGRLTISLSAEAKEDSEVVKDGVELGHASVGVELPVDPGEHVLVLRARGRQNSETRVTLMRGERRTVVLEPGAPMAHEAAGAPGGAGGTSTTPPERGTPSAGDHTWSYVLLGVGAAGLVTTIVAGIEVLAKKSTVADHCVDKVCDQTGYDAGRAGRTFSAIGTVSFVVGAAALGGGIVLLTTSGGGAEHDDARPTAVNGVMGTLRGSF